MTYEEWIEKYEPLTNHLVEGGNAPYDNTMFETYGDELDYVRENNSGRIWTLVETEGNTFIVPGFHLVNRLGYFITMKPWNPEDEEMEIDVYPVTWEERWNHYVGEELDNPEIDKTHVFVRVRNGMVEEVLSSDSNAIIHVVDFDTQEDPAPSINIWEWPETQV